MSETRDEVLQMGRDMVEACPGFSPRAERFLKLLDRLDAQETGSVDAERPDGVRHRIDTRQDCVCQDNSGFCVVGGASGHKG